jgi:hypothetical protein
VTFDDHRSKRKPMLFRALASAAKNELLLILVSRYEADPVGLSDAALSRFLGDTLPSAGYTGRLSPRFFRRVLKQCHASERGPKAAGNDPRDPSADDRSLP